MATLDSRCTLKMLDLECLRALKDLEWPYKPYKSLYMPHASMNRKATTINGTSAGYRRISERAADHKVRHSKSLVLYAQEGCPHSK